MFASVSYKFKIALVSKLAALKKYIYLNSFLGEETHGFCIVHALYTDSLVESSITLIQVEVDQSGKSTVYRVHVTLHRRHRIAFVINWSFQDILSGILYTVRNALPG